MSGARHLYQSADVERVTKVVSVRAKGKSSWGTRIWELTLADGTSLRTSAQSTHPFKKGADYPGGAHMRLAVSKARGTVVRAAFV